MLKNDSTKNYISNAIKGSANPVKIDILADQLNLNRRTVQNYFYSLKAEDPNYISVPGRKGGLFYNK